VDIYRNDIYVDNNKVWHQGNDGSGTGLDADTLDTYQASAFALLAGATFTGYITHYGATYDIASVKFENTAWSSGDNYRIGMRAISSSETWLGVSLNMAGYSSDLLAITREGYLRVGNSTDLYSAKIQTNGNIHAQGAVTSELYLQMKSASAPSAATGFIRMWFDGTNIKAILPGGTTKTLSWT